MLRRIDLVGVSGTEDDASEPIQLEFSFLSMTKFSDGHNDRNRKRQSSRSYHEN